MHGLTLHPGQVGGITDGIVHMTGLDRAQFAVVNHVADMVKVVREK